MAPRVLLLFGGGLDSRLAHELLAREGHEVTPVHFDTGFVHAERGRAVDRQRIERVDVARDYLREVVVAPRHGRGAGLNACRDCRRFLLERAAMLAREREIALLATGDVPGQRALDQSRSALAHADREAGVEGRVLRPLGAAGLRVRGAERRRQLDLARELGIDAGPAAGGGCCLLADRRFARRVRDLVEHREARAIDRRTIDRLRVGRHYRLDWEAKLVVARDGAESQWLAAHAGPDWVCRAEDDRGPVALLDADPRDERGALAAAIVARHGPLRDRPVVPITMGRGDEIVRVAARPAGAADLDACRL